MNNYTTPEAGLLGAVAISGEEYKELLIKAWKYDRLRAEALKMEYHTTFEEVVFEIRREQDAGNVDNG